jgi:hypothetical protein
VDHNAHYAAETHQFSGPFYQRDDCDNDHDSLCPSYQREN